jgi:hypothetical protein
MISMETDLATRNLESREPRNQETPKRASKRNPGAAIETTEITNSEGAKVAWNEVKNACEIEGLTITEVCTRYRLKYPAVYARAARGKWKVVSSIKKRAKELQQREAELTTTAAQWAKRGETHRLLVFDKASGAIEKARMRPPKSWKEFDLADRAARRAAGLENAGRCSANPHPLKRNRR